MDMAQQIEETLKRKDELERQTDGRGQQQTQPPRCGAADGDEDKDDAGNCRGGSTTSGQSKQRSPLYLGFEAIGGASSAPDAGNP
jgi:hypothetical protein